MNLGLWSVITLKKEGFYFDLQIEGNTEDHKIKHEAYIFQ